jgi:hypothetical protein
MISRLHTMVAATCTARIFDSLSVIVRSARHLSRVVDVMFVEEEFLSEIVVSSVVCLKD